MVEDNLLTLAIKERKLSFNKKIEGFKDYMSDVRGHNQLTFLREITSPMDRKVKVKLNNGKEKEVLMFGSNNYLGFANDTYIKSRIAEQIDSYGVGVAGPPLLNGYSSLVRKIEKRISDFKKSEDTLIFPSGFQANFGMLTGLLSKNDFLVYDELSHASTLDGINAKSFLAKPFLHNSIESLEKVINENDFKGQLFVAVEGLYSMDGDIAPLEKILAIVNKYNGICLLDDAHGTGVLGKSGKGAYEMFDFPKGNILHIGTFSKTFSVNGGFVAGDQAIIEYLRFHSRMYMFSAALSPLTLYAINAGFDLIAKDAWRREKLAFLKDYAVEKFSKFSFTQEPAATILAVMVPKHVNIREACNRLLDLGFFVNAVEYPAVPKNQERFRISLMVHHTEKDIADLAKAIESVIK